MSEPKLPMKLFVELCEVLGYEPGQVVSMRINHKRITVVYDDLHDVRVFRHTIE